jgi:hypothetical protein
MVSSLPVHDAAYGGYFTFAEGSDTHRADADLARKNDRVPFRRQRNLELTEENKISKSRCALRQHAVMKLSVRLPPTLPKDGDGRLEVGQFPSSDKSR